MSIYLSPHRAMSLCTMVYPTSIRTTDVMWSPGMIANWMATNLRWRYKVANVNCNVITRWRNFNNQSLHHQSNVGCFLQNPSKECEPYRTSDGLPIAPCGAIANSLFNGKWDIAIILMAIFILSGSLSPVSHLEVCCWMGLVTIYSTSFWCQI